MEDEMARFKVAVVQAAPVAFDRERTLAKVHSLAAEAARQDARLVVFPEAFVSAYPRGLDFGAVVGSRTDEGREDFRRYWESSVEIPGPAVDSLARTARICSSVANWPTIICATSPGITCVAQKISTDITARTRAT